MPGPLRVCDTNVFYNLAIGRVSGSKLKAHGGRVAITPVSILELASHVNDGNLADRRAAAGAAIQYVDEVLPDPESYLAEVWSVQREPEKPVPWKDVLVALRDARTVSELTGGVADFQARVVRTINVPMAYQWRTFHYKDFLDKMVSAVDQFVPGYEKARATGKMHLPKKAEAQKLSAMFSNPAVLYQVLLGTWERAHLVGGAKPSAPPQADQVEEVLGKLIAYVCVYAKYFEQVATKYAPQPNDWGDLECFIFLCNDREVITAESRWLEIASALGLEGAVRNATVEFAP